MLFILLLIYVIPAFVIGFIVWLINRINANKLKDVDMDIDYECVIMGLICGIIWPLTLYYIIVIKCHKIDLYQMYCPWYTKYKSEYEELHTKKAILTI